VLIFQKNEWEKKSVSPPKEDPNCGKMFSGVTKGSAGSAKTPCSHTKEKEPTRKKTNETTGPDQNTQYFAGPGRASRTLNVLTVHARQGTSTRKAAEGERRASKRPKRVSAEETFEPSPSMGQSPRKCENQLGDRRQKKVWGKRETHPDCS